MSLTAAHPALAPLRREDEASGASKRSAGIGRK
jgi:hypothetical protein